MDASATGDLNQSLVDGANEDSAVIAQFVANGNGAHDFETVSGTAEVNETVEDTQASDTDVAKTSSNR